MAVYQGYRTYSTDSVGSDVVFSDESPYQGMLRAMDERKGTDSSFFHASYQRLNLFIFDILFNLYLISSAV